MKTFPSLPCLTCHARLTSVASLAACSLALLAPSRASGTSLLSNGSFESPVGSPGLNSGRPTGWSGFGSFSSGVINGTLANRPAPQDGNQFVDIGTGELAQSFTVATSGDYLLTWFDNTITSGNNGSYGVRLRDASLTTISFTAFSYNYSGLAWHARSLDLVGLAAGTYTLTYDPGTTATYLDNVVLDLKSETSVPDSGSTGALFGLALGGMAWLVRKR